jgi:hypothetical protein
MSHIHMRGRPTPHGSGGAMRSRTVVAGAWALGVALAACASALSQTFPPLVTKKPPPAEDAIPPKPPPPKPPPSTPTPASPPTAPPQTVLPSTEPPPPAPADPRSAETIRKLEAQIAGLVEQMRQFEKRMEQFELLALNNRIALEAICGVRDEIPACKAFAKNRQLEIADVRKPQPEGKKVPGGGHKPEEIDTGGRGGGIVERRVCEPSNGFGVLCKDSWKVWPWREVAAQKDLKLPDKDLCEAGGAWLLALNDEPARAAFYVRGVRGARDGIGVCLRNQSTQAWETFPRGTSDGAHIIVVVE